jgi:very-short-patch-repair endonuclease
MRPKSPNRRDWVAGEIADRQHGLVARWQLLAAGMSHRAISRSLDAGRLRPLFRGVYAVGHAVVSTDGWCQAALLACGEKSVLGHRTACTKWSLRRDDLFPLSVIVPGDRGRKHDRIETRRVKLDRRDWMVFDSLRVTTPARTIVDMAGELRGKEMRLLVECAQDIRRFKPGQIRAVLERNPHRPGCRPLLHLVALLDPDADGARSYLERLFLKLVRKAKLPEPEVNQQIEGRERDFVWRDHRLVIEVDGHAHHSSRAAMRRDKARDRELTAALWRPARFTYEDVAFEPEATVNELRNLLRN